MSDPARARKLADRIKVIVAETLERRIKDPRLGFVTITDVRVTGDLQQASVYYTVLGEGDDRASSAAALASAKGVLRSEVGRQTGIRLTPSLEFHLDELPETADAMAELLRQAREHDERVAALAVGASYAGESDPYRKPPAIDDDTEDGMDDDQDLDQTVSHQTVTRPSVDQSVDERTA